MDHFCWYWEIKQDGGGPDYYLALKFDLGDAEFGEWLGDLLSADYIRDHGHPPGWSFKDNQGCNHWHVYGYPGAKIIIELSWGMEQPAADGLLQQLLSSPPGQLVQWQVFAGGQGYGEVSFGQGTDVASFLQYCR